MKANWEKKKEEVATRGTEVYVQSMLVRSSYIYVYNVIGRRGEKRKSLLLVVLLLDWIDLI